MLIKQLIKFKLFVFASLLYIFTSLVAQENHVITSVTQSFVHAPTIVELDSGGLLAAFYAGTKQAASDVEIYLSRFENGEWYQPKVICSSKEVSDSDTSCWNPVLCKMPSGEIGLFYKIGNNPREWTGYLKCSSDNGNNWSNPTCLASYGVVGPTKNQPLIINGKLVCPSSRESWNAWTCSIEIMEQINKWFVKPISYEKQTCGIIEPTLFIDNDGNLRMLCRSKKIGSLCTTMSKDGGETWEKVQTTNLQSNDSAIAALRLKDGRILLVYSDLPEGKRYKLDLAISNDGGETWKNCMVIDSAQEDLDHAQIGYPSIIQTKDDRVHIVYTGFKRKQIKHVVLDPTTINI